MMKRLWQWSVLLGAMQIVGAVQLLAQGYAVSWFVSGEVQVVYLSAGEEIVPQDNTRIFTSFSLFDSVWLRLSVENSG